MTLQSAIKTSGAVVASRGRFRGDGLGSWPPLFAFGGTKKNEKKKKLKQYYCECYGGNKGKHAGEVPRCNRYDIPCGIC